MLESVGKNGHTFEECKKVLKDSTPLSLITNFHRCFSGRHNSDIKLDSGFKDFFRYCKSQDIPVIIVSRYGEHEPSVPPLY
jgi:hypothetical protein